MIKILHYSPEYMLLATCNNSIFWKWWLIQPWKVYSVHVESSMMWLVYANDWPDTDAQYDASFMLMWPNLPHKLVKSWNS